MIPALWPPNVQQGNQAQSINRTPAKSSNTYTSREPYRVFHFTAAAFFLSCGNSLRWVFSYMSFPLFLFQHSYTVDVLLTLTFSYSGQALSDKDCSGIIPPSCILRVLHIMCRLTIFLGGSSSYFRLANIDPLWDKLSTCQYTLLLMV